MRSTRSGRWRMWGQDGQQLVVDELAAVDDRIGGSVTLISSIAEVISDRPGQSTRSVPSTVTSARDSRTMSVGRRMPKSDSTTTSSCITLRVDRPAGTHVLGHQPGQRPLQLVRGRRLGHVGDPLDTVAQQPDVAL